jgi:hypothetical protein
VRQHQDLGVVDDRVEPVSDGDDGAVGKLVLDGGLEVILLVSFDRNLRTTLNQQLQVYKYVRLVWLQKILQYLSVIKYFNYACQ